ncbi:MAG TPA: universal stress protein [Sandaracinaceae bacterium]
MPEIRRVLCPVDFSPHSENAVRFAVELAEKLGAEVHLLHVYQLPVYALPDGAMMAGPEFTTKVTAELQKALSALAQSFEPAKLPTHLVEGVPYREVVRMTEELGADLVVMGTHGRTGLKHLLLGSVAERVVRSSSVPVITVPLREE